jgi:hypothetical protein
MKYTMEELKEIFEKHRVESEKNNQELTKSHLKSYPKEPIPKHFKNEFSLPEALRDICAAIKELQNQISCTEKHDK